MYRKEIDGLRAVAVLPVIFYHAGVTAFSGGYVGVDIFFVISGYLITTLILAELAKEKFSILNFYERRARRILPALLFIILLCVPISILWMPTDKLEEFANSVIANSIFSSNVLFWGESGYFALASDEKPLIHTWSLAVEEQYYIFFPVFMIVLWKFQRMKVTVALMIIIAVLSFLFAEWASKAYPTANFYLIPGRSWELLMGALVAVYLNVRIKDKNYVSDSLAMLGLLLILVSIFIYSKATPFPGAYALLPTLGTALIIIFAVKETWVNRVLGHKYLVGIGLISYSAYLWHQPLFAFARIRSISEPETNTFIILTFIALFLAFLSWRFIEKPFRNREFLNQSKVIKLSIFSLIILACTGAVIKYNSEMLADPYLSIPKNISVNKCTKLSLASYPDSCSLGKPAKKGQPIDVVVWGDSYADALLQGISKQLVRYDLSGRSLIMHSCPSIKGVLRNEPVRLGQNFAQKCNEYISQSFYEILNSNIQTVVLTSSYRRYFNDKNLNGNPILIPEKKIPDELDDDNLIKYFVDTVEAFINAGKKVIVVLPHAYLNKPDFKGLLKRRYFTNKDGEMLMLDSTEPIKTAQKITRMLSSRSFGKKLSLVDPNEILCSQQGLCSALSKNNHFYLSDGSHFSLYGADRIARLIEF